MYLFLIAGLLTIVLFRIINKKIPPPVFGVYQNPGKWYYLKIAFMFTVLKIRKIQNVLSLHKSGISSDSASAHASAGYGIKSKSDPANMDCRQPLSDHPKAIDAVYFNLASKEGWNLVIGTAIRPHGIVNGFLYLRIPGVGLLTTPKLPDTLLFRDKDDEDVLLYEAEGIKLTPFTPMRTWRIQYVGKMRCEDGRLLDVNLDAVWSSNLDEFDFDTDMDALCVARCMAREPWSKEYFTTVQDFHQTHYEQHGDLHGTVTLNNETLLLSMNGVRDHSYGRRREWKHFHRYALHFITLEDGYRISIGVICAPVAFSRMVIGYMYQSDGSLIPVQSCDLALYLHGEEGSPPKDYAFSFQAGCKNYLVEVLVDKSPAFYVGWEWEARVVESLARFRVNGVAGWGATEWEYRNVTGRPEKYAEQDPAWTHELNKG